MTVWLLFKYENAPGDEFIAAYATRESAERERDELTAKLHPASRDGYLIREAQVQS